MQPQQTSLGAGRKVSLLAFQELSENPTENLQIATGNLQNSTKDLPPSPQTAYGNRSSSGSVNSCNSESLLTNVLSSLPVGGTMQPQTSALSDLVCAIASSERPNVPASTSLTSHQTSSTIIVMEITPPVIGMTFSCYEDAREFYDAYSMRVGFGTKVKSSSFDRKTNEKNLVLLTCCKQGYKNESNIVCYRRPNVRVGCNAHLKIKLNDDKQWKVISIELEHNHECSPSKSRRFRSHKHMESGSKRRLELNCNSGVSLSKSYWTFVREAGGYEHVPFDQRDARNHIDKYRRLQLKEGDAESMHKYFQRYDVLHPYALQILEEGALSETKYKIVMDGLLDLKRKVLNADGGHEASDIEESQTPFNNGAESMQSEYVKLKNPLQATKIGRPKGRLISSSEKNVKSKITKQKKVSSKAKDSQTAHKNDSSQKKANVGRDCEDDGGLPILENQFPSQETIFEVSAALLS